MQISLSANIAAQVVENISTVRTPWQILSMKSSLEASLLRVLELIPIQYTSRSVPQLVYGSRSEYLLNVNRLPHSGQRYDRRGIPRDQSATSTARHGTSPHRPKAHGSFVRELKVAFFIWLCLKFITILRNTFSANYII